MFTGIVETMGTVREIRPGGSNLSFLIESDLGPSLKVDQSLSHDGACLTVEAVNGRIHQVTAVQETLEKTNLLQWKPGHRVNLERAMQMGGRLDGHLVQGHVDAKGSCLSVESRDGSWEFVFSYPPAFASLVIEKGSICVNGTSLTAFDLQENRFRVAIIPYTYEHTNISTLQPGSLVNLEFDMIGKYIARWRELGS
ncbi:MAG: riboflavin synthase [Chitinophagaceae bacterium]|jgi:riboflavin synthase|nr:riboflavin synthase [Chitinophagaceae bacterium]